jgi:chromosome segregation ATPase
MGGTVPDYGDDYASSRGRAAASSSNDAAAAARGLEAARGDALDSEAASSALRSRLDAAERRRSQAEDRSAAAEVRSCNERARLESKLRAARDDGSVRIQSLEATVTSLRTRSGLHSEVARLGDEATQLQRAKARLRHELNFAEERLGHALLELQQLRGGDRQAAGAAGASGFGSDAATRAGALAIRGDGDNSGKQHQQQQRRVSYAAAAASAAAPVSSVAAAVSDQASREGALERTQDRLVSLEKDAVRYLSEVERLRDEVESAALERGREAAARADASRELAAALERVAERDRALHDAREAAALGGVATEVYTHTPEKIKTKRHPPGWVTLPDPAPRRHPNKNSFLSSGDLISGGGEGEGFFPGAPLAS